jgi:DNA-binding MarR family transcriptional regulator
VAEDDRFAQLLTYVAREITLRQAADVCCGDLTLEQFQTLKAIHGSARPSIGALSLELRVDLSTMSRNITLLERNGYLSRARSAEDGRVVHVRLTAEGRRALKTLHCEEKDVLGQIYDQIPSGERPRVVRALEALRTCLERSSTRSDAVGTECCAPAPSRKVGS